MRTVLMVPGGRPVPNTLVSGLQQAGWRSQYYQGEGDFRNELAGVDAVLLLSPCWVNRSYEFGEQLWYLALRRHQDDLPLVVAGYQRPRHTNYLDLLQLETQAASWWDQLQPVAAMRDVDYQDSLRPKLHRFFAGHGADSVVAVMSRIRLVVQMAQREHLEMHTPYVEIYRDLIAPAQLSQKWGEWRNRWVNYHPLFRYSPLAGALQAVGRYAQQLDDWMFNGGVEEAPLASGEILTILKAVKDTLQEIENQYVLQKLPHSHR
jgi:hypothetical protein